MFGRRKDQNADLDWQPEPAMPVMETEQAAAMSSHSYQTHAHANTYEQSDTWSGFMHPRAVIGFLRKSFKTIATYALVFTLLGLAVYFLLPSRYGSTALILVDPRQTNVTNAESAVSVIGGDAAALTSYVEVMNSDGFLRKIVREFDVKNDPEFAKAKNETDLVEKFADNLSAKRQGATYVVKVYYKSKSAENAAKYANGIAEAFVRDQRDFRTSTNEEASQWLSERLTLLQTNLKKSENAVAAFQARNGIVNAGEQGTLDNQQLASLVAQLATATTELAEAKARYQQASKDGVPASANMSQSNQFTNLDQLLQEQARLRRLAAELGQTLGPRHPTILANTKQQGIIANQISQERRRLVVRAKQAFQTAEAKKISLEGQLADARQRSIQLNKSMVELATLEREATANRNLYEQFLARFKLTDEQSRLQFSEARIVSEATVPFKSTKPLLILVVPVLLVLGVGLGTLAALLKEAFASPHPQSQAEPQSGRPGTRMHAVPSHPLARDAEAMKQARQALDQREESAEQSLPTPPLRRLDANDIGSEPETTSFMAATPDQKLDRSPDPVGGHDPVAGEEFDGDSVDASERHAHAGSVAPMPDEADPTADGFGQDEEQGAAIPTHGVDESADDDGSTVVHLGREPNRSSSRADRAAAARRARSAEVALSEAETVAPDERKPAIIITLPERQISDEEAMLDDLLDQYHDTLDAFVATEQNKDMVALMITSAQPGDGQYVMSDLAREFAIDSGFHPVMIALQERSDQAAKAASATAPVLQAPRVQEFEAFDLIPFVTGGRFGQGQGLGDALSGELASLIALCKDNYGFVILETQQILDPETLEDLIGLVDASLLVIEENKVTPEDLHDWQDWAGSTGVGLVLDQTRD